jgi:hypothetical protein
MTAEELQNYLLESTEQVQSFSGQYAFTQENSNGFKINAVHDYRFQGDNLYISHDEEIPESDPRSEQGRRLEIASRFNGVTSSFSSAPTAVPGEPAILQGRIGWNEMPIEQEAYLSPNSILGTPIAQSVREQFASGETELVQENGEWILRHYDWEHCLRRDYTFDNELHLRSTKTGTIPHRYVADFCAQAGYPKESLFHLNETVEMSEYQVVSGAPLPMNVARTLYEHTISKERQNEFLEKFGNAAQGDVSADMLPYILEFYGQTNPSTTVRARQEIRFDVEGLKINELLTDEDFKISYPKGTRLFNLMKDVFIVGDESTDSIVQAMEASPAIAAPQVAQAAAVAEAPAAEDQDVQPESVQPRRSSWVVITIALAVCSVLCLVVYRLATAKRGGLRS